MNTDYLHYLLNESHSYHAEYGEKLSNHLPMTLIALSHLGADEHRLNDFFNHYKERLIPKDPLKMMITNENWKDFLGQHDKNSDYVQYFTLKVKQDGIKKTLENFLPFLSSGLAGGAFHPLIRTAYGVDIHSEKEVIEGLASFCLAYLPLSELTSLSSTATKPLEVLSQMHNDLNLRKLKIDAPNIFSRMLYVARNEAFLPYLNSLNSSQTNLKDIAGLALNLYLSSDDDFTALHVVTSAHALRLLQNFFPSFDTCLSVYWQALCAAYVTIDMPEIKSHALQKDLPSWQDIFEKACSSHNDHVIKFVYTCSEEEKYYQNPLYRQAAALKAGLLNLS
jgi:hypothetical protein